MPALNIPAKVVPAHNAFDDLKKASDLIVYDYDIGSAPGKPSKDAKPGPPNRHQDKTEGVNCEGQKVPSWRLFDNDHLYTLADKQMLVDANRDALNALRQSLPDPYMDVYKRSWGTMFPYYARFRSMARLLALEAEVRGANGDWNGAMQSSLDSIEMGVKMAKGGPLIGRLVGIACEAIGRQQAWKCVEHLDAAQTLAAMRRLDAIRAQHTPMADTMREEKWMTQESLRDTMRSSLWRVQMLSMFTGDNFGNDRKFDARGLLLYGWSDRAILNDVGRYEDEVARRTTLPYQTAKALPPIFMPTDPLAEILFPVFDQATFKDVEASQTQDALLLVTLALRACHLETGAYPQTLQELTPRYLAAIPADPFAMGNAPLRYQKRPVHDNFYAWEPAWKRQEVKRLTQELEQPAYPGRDAYTLYSVGPDGRDDGGQGIDELARPRAHADPNWQKPKADSVQRYQVLADSAGDIVAGLNTR